MGAFREYIASGGEISEQALNELIDRYEWFSVARGVRETLDGKADGRLAVARSSRAVGMLRLLPVDGSKLTTLSPEELIERFLREDDLRIVAEDGEPDTDIRIEAEFTDEDDLVSEDLAEIYLAQGLRAKALDTYRKLSLLNPEKSVYFAGLIEKIETNN